MLVTSCFVFNFWMMLFNQLWSASQRRDFTLHFISFEEPSLLFANSGTGFLKIRRLWERFPSKILSQFDCMNVLPSRSWRMSSKVIGVCTTDIKLKQTRFARRRVYTISALKLGFRWDFTVQTPVILLKNIFEFMFNTARSTLYR